VIDEQRDAPKADWRWTVAAAVALMLVAYPFVNWLTGGSRPAPVTASAESSSQEAMELYQAGQYQEAVAAAKASIALNPKLADAYNNLAVSYLQLRQYDEGIQAAQEAIRLKPDFQLAKNNLAWIQREKAGAAAPQPESKPAEPPGVLLNRSLEAAQAGRFNECVDNARGAVKGNPQLAQAYNNLGFCAGKLEHWDEAIRSLQRAIRIDPNFTLAKNNLAAIQRQKLEADQKTAK
jgi:tetratricopeptide (TPR) repeat protein